ncbi:hypothetical protein VF21_09566 [Pseudogymnoascus sp. 05NY08]|nr:hypothetical protein VF21_09566 [Pseudogymnoascus sp. 05NY08]
MEAKQPASERLNFFHKDNVRFKTLEDISKSISDLYVSMENSHTKLGRRDDLPDSLLDHGKAIGKLIVCNKAEARRAEVLVARLHFEMRRIYESEEETMKWAEALWVIEKILGLFVANGEEMEKYWKRSETYALAEGTDDGTDLFHQILANRLEKFGVQEVEDVLNQFVVSKEHDAEKAENMREESERSKMLDIARDEIREVFEALTEELEELKEESEELRDELEVLKKGGRH